MDVLTLSSATANITNPSKILSLVGAFAITLNSLNVGTDKNDSAAGSGDRATKAREAMAYLLQKVPLDSIQTVTGVQSALAVVLGNSNQINLKTCSSAADISKRSADYILQSASNGMSSNQLQSAIYTSLNAAGSILEVNSHLNAQSPVLNGGLSGAMVAVVNTLGDAMLNRQVVGEASYLARSSGITLTAEKKLASSISEGFSGDSESGNGLRLPNLQIVGNGTGSAVLRTQVTVFSKNPFLSVSNESIVDSNVVVTKVASDNQGITLNTEKLLNATHVFLKKESLPGSASKNMSGEAATYGQLTAKVHKVPLPKNQGLYIAFDYFQNISDGNVTAKSNSDLHANYSLVILMSVDLVPNKTVHNYNCTLPIVLSNTGSSNSTFIERGGVYSTACMTDGLDESKCQGQFVYNDLSLFPKGNAASVQLNTCYIPVTYLKRTPGRQLYLRVLYVPTSQLESWNTAARLMSLTKADPSNSKFKISYSALAYTVDCRYWDSNSDTWIDDGCMAGPLSQLTSSHCICDRLSVSASNTSSLRRVRRSTATGTSTSSGGIAFGSGLTISVNSVNLADSAFNHLDDNPLIFSTMTSIMCIYICALIWTIKRDRVDQIKASILPLIDNEPTSHYLYEVTVYTGNMHRAGTTARVGMIFTGDGGESMPRPFCNDERQIFQRAGIDSFLMAVPQSLGSLSYLRVWHDNSGYSPSWYLNRIVIVDLQTTEKFYFVVNKWISETKDDCQRCRLIQVAGRNDLTRFGNVFWMKTRKDLLDSHLWFSVLGRPHTSRFTRTQRCTCCLSLLFSLMTANLMFYNKIVTGDQFIMIGQTKLTLGQIIQGIIASFVVLPINIIIVQIFRKSEPRYSTANQKLRNQRVSPEIISELSEMPIASQTGGTHGARQLIFDNGRLEFSRPQSLVQGGRPASGVVKNSVEGIQLKKHHLTNRRRFLPWWCTIIAYFLCLSVCGVSFWYVVEAGFVLGQESSTKWLVAFLTSVIESICLSQPIKVIVMAIFMSLVIKKPAHDDDTIMHKGTRRVYLEKHLKGSNTAAHSIVDAIRSMIRIPDAPTQQMVLAAAQQRTRKNEATDILIEVGSYITFIILLMLTSYGNMDTNSGPAYRNLENNVRFGLGTQNNFLADTLEKGIEYKSLWRWFSSAALPSIYKDSNFTSNNHKILDELDGFFLVSQLRLRQFRLSNSQPCGYKLFNRSTCYGDFQSSPEDTGSYGNAWSPTIGVGASGYRDAWIWKSASDSDGYELLGNVGGYPGSGFSIQLGRSLQEALQATEYLEYNDWLDERSRAFMIEFAMYNANVNLVAVSFILIELLPLGVTQPKYKMNLLRYDAYNGNVLMATLAAQVGIIIFVGYFTYQQVRLINNLKRKYIKNPGHMLDFLTLMLCYTAVILFASKMTTLEAVKLKVSQQNSFNNYVNFQSSSSWDEWYSNCLGFTTFVATLKFLKLLRFNNRISLLFTTMKSIVASLISFMICLIVILIAFVHMTCLIYGSVVDEFSTFPSACQYLFVMMLNKFDYQSLKNADPVFAPFFLPGFVIIVNIILLSMMMTIIMEGFKNTRTRLKDMKNRHDILNFIVSEIKNISGFGNQYTCVNELAAEKTLRSQSKSEEKNMQANYEQAQEIIRHAGMKDTTWLVNEVQPGWYMEVQNALKKLDESFMTLVNPSAASQSHED